MAWIRARRLEARLARLLQLVRLFTCDVKGHINCLSAGVGAWSRIAAVEVKRGKTQALCLDCVFIGVIELTDLSQCLGTKCGAQAFCWASRSEVIVESGNTAEHPEHDLCKKGIAASSVQCGPDLCCQTQEKLYVRFCIAVRVNFPH